MGERRHGDEPTRTAERVIVGHCPNCGRVLVLFNNHETWSLFRCGDCHWVGATGEIVNYVRVARNFVVTNRHEQPIGNLE